MSDLRSIKRSKIDRTEILLNLIMKPDLVYIKVSNVLQIQPKATRRESFYVFV